MSMTDKPRDDDGPPFEHAGADELAIAEACQREWETMIPAHVKARIVERAGGDASAAYQAFAKSHAELLRRRRRRRTRHYSYYEFDVLTGVAQCEPCGWEGSTKDHYQVGSDVLFVDCPRCGDGVVVVALPTFAETRAAAALGDVRAIADLKVVEMMERRTVSARTYGITVERLPELVAQAIDLTWDQVSENDDEWTVLLHRGKEIGREPCFYAGQARFDEVVDILRLRYGDKFRSLVATERSRPYLLGDRF